MELTQYNKATKICPENRLAYLSLLSKSELALIKVNGNAALPSQYTRTVYRHVIHTPVLHGFEYHFNNKRPCTFITYTQPIVTRYKVRLAALPLGNSFDFTVLVVTIQVEQKNDESGEWESPQSVVWVTAMPPVLMDPDASEKRVNKKIDRIIQIAVRRRYSAAGFDVRVSSITDDFEIWIEDDIRYTVAGMLADFTESLEKELLTKTMELSDKPLFN